MRLLIITQKIDENDPILGFFVSWVAELANTFEQVQVICLEKGAYNLPENATVHSLGKEQGKNKLQILFAFYHLIFKLRRRYDSVFVHMNSIYVLLGAALWKLQGKRVFLWYNHTHGRLLDSLAFRFVRNVFHTSPYAFSANRPNSKKMPAGINTTAFRNILDVYAPKKSILFLGRIAPVKNLDTLLKAAQILHEKSIAFTLDIYGAALKKDEPYLEKLKEEFHELVEAGKLTFHEPVPNRKAPEIYNTHEVFVNLTPAGNYDKTVLEALACESAALVSSKAFADILPAEYTFSENDAHNLARRLESFFVLPEETRTAHAAELRTYVDEHHSLSVLANEIENTIREDK